MSTRSKTSVSTLWCRSALGSLLVACAGSTFAQAPDAPHIDWTSTVDGPRNTSNWTELDIGWSHTGLEPVTSVQYRLDGLPVMSHAVARGQDYGQAVLPIRSDSEHELTVALCNSDGCSESSRVRIASADYETGNAPAAVTWSQDQVRLVLERIRADTEMLTQVYGEAATGPAAAAVPFALASMLGKAALSGIIRGGADFAFQSLMEHLGLGPDDFGAQIDQLQSSMDALNTQVSELTHAIEDLHDETTWQGFLNQHKDANIAVNLIYANFGHVTGWIDNGIEVDDFAWTTVRKNIADALTVLGGAKMNAAGGIVDARDGAIYQLMNAIPQRVASTASYWPLIDEYRDYYRAAFAIGFLGLDLVEDHFDGSGTTRVMADDALQVGQRATLSMYAYGVAPALPEAMDFVQLRGSVDGYASTAFAAAGGGAGVRLAGPQLRSAFAQMANDYRPEHHGGRTLEAFLAESGLATTYVIDHADGWKSTGWQVTQVSAGKPHLGQPPKYHVRPLVGRVRDNQWIEAYEPFCGRNPCMFGAEGLEALTEQQIQWFIDDGKTAIRTRGGYDVDYWTFAVSHYGAINLTDRLNHAGRPAEFDPEAVRVAAFGNGAIVADDAKAGG